MHHNLLEVSKHMTTQPVMARQGRHMAAIALPVRLGHVVTLGPLLMLSKELVQLRLLLCVLSKILGKT